MIWLLYQVLTPSCLYDRWNPCRLTLLPAMWSDYVCPSPWEETAPHISYAPAPVLSTSLFGWIIYSPFQNIRFRHLSLRFPFVVCPLNYLITAHFSADCQLGVRPLLIWTLFFGLGRLRRQSHTLTNYLLCRIFSYAFGTTEPKKTHYLQSYRLAKHSRYW